MLSCGDVNPEVRGRIFIFSGDKITITMVRVIVEVIRNDAWYVVKTVTCNMEQQFMPEGEEAHLYHMYYM